MRLLMATMLVGMFLVGSSFGQEIPIAPTAPTLRDDNIRLRSVDLERTSRDAKKAKASSNVNPKISAKFSEINEDFNGIQMSQSGIIKAYQVGKVPNYVAIDALSSKITSHSERLHTNLFMDKVETKRKKKKKKGDQTDAEIAPSMEMVKNLIVELDNAIGALTQSKMFQNLLVVEPSSADEAHAELVKIMMLSKKLSKTAGAMK